MMNIHKLCLLTLSALTLSMGGRRLRDEYSVWWRAT